MNKIKQDNYVMNIMQKKINDTIKNLNERRASGRTDQILNEMVNFVSQGTSGQKIILFALTQDIANEIQIRFIEKISPACITKIGNSIEVNSVLVYFKDEYYKNNPSYKYETWDKSYYDNSIDDSYTAEYIRSMQRELVI